MINQAVILPQVMTRIGDDPYCWGFGIPIRYWRVSREVYFLVQRSLIKIKPRQGQMAGLILPHPSHESRDGAWVLSFADDFHPLSPNESEIGPNTCATHGNINGDG